MKNQITQFSLVLIAFVGMAFLMSYTRPAADEPKQYILVRSVGDSEDNFATLVNKKISEGWHLQGGTSQMKNGFCQAMVK
jgi:hypothetical protein